MKNLYLFVPALIILLCSFAIFRKNSKATLKNLITVFTKEYTKPGGYPHVVEVAGDEKNGFVILSTVIVDWGSYTRLTKVDASGKEEWSYDYYADEWKEPEFLKKTVDGYIVGVTHVPNRINRTVILMKVDLNGNKVWDR